MECCFYSSKVISNCVLMGRGLSGGMALPFGLMMDLFFFSVSKYDKDWTWINPVINPLNKSFYMKVDFIHLPYITKLIIIPVSKTETDALLLRGKYLNT